MASQTAGAVSIVEQYRRQTEHLPELLAAYIKAVAQGVDHAAPKVATALLGSALQLEELTDPSTAVGNVGRSVLQDLESNIGRAMAVSAYADACGIDQMSKDDALELQGSLVVLCAQAMLALAEHDELREVLNFFIRLGRVMRVRLAEQAQQRSQ